MTATVVPETTVVSDSPTTWETTAADAVEPAQPKYPGLPEVINGNGAVAHVMKHVCGGVIGYPITPSTEISENFEAARAEGQLNVWGKHPFFVETEGEHSAQSGALGAALTGGAYISNASSSQGILYGLESHFVTAGKKVGGFVLQVAARVVSKHSLNVMAGHDDVYALLPAGYTILFGANQQEAADLAAIAFRTAALSLIPVANAMDGFATSHVMSEVNLPEPELLKEYLGDPASRIPCPTVAQEILFGAKGRVFQLSAWLDRHARDIPAANLAAAKDWLGANAAMIEADNQAAGADAALAAIPPALQAQWRRAWVGAHQKGTRQLVPALVDPHNPGLTGAAQNQPDFQAGTADHRTHFAAAVPQLARQAMAEYADLTGRVYQPIMCYDTADADYIVVALGSIADDIRAVLPYLRANGLKAGLVSVKLLQPFPEAELAAALSQAKVVTVFERSDDTALTRFVTGALFKARSNADHPEAFPGIPALTTLPQLITAFFGLGSHDVQPRHLIAAYKHMTDPKSPLVYLGTHFFNDHATGAMAEIEAKLRLAYPETELMTLPTEPNPVLLPPGAMRIRFHSVGGYGSISTGKLLTDILAGMLGMHSKSAPKYGSEKSGSPTNYYLTVSPEPILFTNNDLEDVEVVLSPDHMVFHHTNPLKGLVKGGTFIMQSSEVPLSVWRSLPQAARRYIRDNQITFGVVDAFAVARRHAPTAQLETRMMGVAFVGALLAGVKELGDAADPDLLQREVQAELTKKYASKGQAVVEANLSVVLDGMNATHLIDYTSPEFVAADAEPSTARSARAADLSAAMCPVATAPAAQNLFDPAYYEDLMARPFRDGTISAAPALPGIGLFIPPASGALRAKGLFRRQMPVFDPGLCTACMDCVVACPDTALPNTVHELPDLLAWAIAAAGVTPDQRTALLAQLHPWAEAARAAMLANAGTTFQEAVTNVGPTVFAADRPLADAARRAANALAGFPVAAPRPIFAAVEKATPGHGGLYSVVVDPSKCTGCLECVQVCGPHALTATDQTEVAREAMEATFARLTELPATPARFASTADGDLKRILLDRATYYSLSGGHSACRGCGEVTATHLFTALAHHVGQDRRAAHIRHLEDLIDRLYVKQRSVDDAARRSRIGGVISTLSQRLYLYESGPTGRGPAPTIVANSTGCSSIYASSMPSTPFLNPWVNSLFQDAQPLAMGIYEGLTAQYTAEIQGLRQAELELADDPAAAEPVAPTLTWRDFTEAEREVLPTVMTISGDGAAYDIGFGAMSRVMAMGTPIRMLVLDTGGYSNTGGQASTASYTGQDVDLARYGRTHGGKLETRKELGLLAALHPHVFVCATATAFHGHYLQCALRMLRFESGSSLMVAYTPCGTENGFAEDLSTQRARLAVESRLAPLYVHDPSLGSTLNQRFSLEGNPDPTQLWTNTVLAYTDDSGQAALLTTPLTPADFALGEVRFAKHFRPLADGADGLPLADYIELPAAERAGQTPYIFTTDKQRHLIKLACAAPVVALVEDRKHYWQTLQYLAGIGAEPVVDDHLDQELAELRTRYDQALADREASMDAIAQTMVNLVMAKDPSTVSINLPGLTGAAAAPSAGPSAGSNPTPAPGSTRPSASPAASAPAKPAVWLDPKDQPRCNDCGTCYQELPQFFERTTILVDGQPQQVARFKEGSLNGVTITPELAARIERVRDTCDSEIIQ